jgi:hypothetical protein
MRRHSAKGTDPVPPDNKGTRKAFGWHAKPGPVLRGFLKSAKGADARPEFTEELASYSRGADGPGPFCAGS